MRRALAGLALVVVVLSGAAEAGAHEQAPTTAASDGGAPAHAPMAFGATTAGSSDPVTAAGVPAGEPGRPGARAPYASAPWLWIGAVGLGALATWFAVARRPQGAWGREPALAGALVFTAVVHLLEAPTHWTEGWFLGAFFAASGAVLLGQAAVAATRATRELHLSVVATAGVLLVLYLLVRQVSLPLLDHRDPYRLVELPVKAVEVAAGSLSLARLIAMRRSPVSAVVLAAEHPGPLRQALVHGGRAVPVGTEPAGLGVRS